MLYDAFISHASEDKDGLVRPLAQKLIEQHVSVWYDEFSLNIGDSLRRSIDRGLSQSRYGIVVLSPSFFRKQWSQWELDGLVARQNAGPENVILPVWHNVSVHDVLQYSPPLADRLAVSSALGLDDVVRRLSSIIHPRGSTLVIARDHLIDHGLNPPVLTDDWWLDVAAASESNDMEGDFQEPMGWGRWGFPLPPSSTDPIERGWRLASAAMQRAWQRKADDRPITQITRPEEVHAFINSQPGLADTCAMNTHYLVSYAPQLVISGFGGEFEAEIEGAYQRSVVAYERLRASSSSRQGIALTTDGRPPGCDDEFSLRDPEFGRYEAPHVACGFVQGTYVANGPPVKYYEVVDYAAWLLSEESLWLPSHVRDVLTRGIAGWGVWTWSRHNHRVEEEFGFETAPFTGRFEEAIWDVESFDSFEPNEDALRDVEHRLTFSAELLGLPEDGGTLSQRFLSREFLVPYFDDKKRRTARRKKRKA
jgi:hypothetical protein